MKRCHQLDLARRYKDVCEIIHEDLDQHKTCEETLEEKEEDIHLSGGKNTEAVAGVSSSQTTTTSATTKDPRARLKYSIDVKKSKSTICVID